MWLPTMDDSHLPLLTMRVAMAPAILMHIPIGDRRKYPTKVVHNPHRDRCGKLPSESLHAGVYWRPRHAWYSGTVQNIWLLPVVIFSKESRGAAMPIVRHGLARSSFSRIPRS